MRINKREYESKRDRKTDPFYLSYTWKKLRIEILERDNYLCQCDKCKKLPVPKIAKVVDHIKPIRLGGHPTDRNNLQSMNYGCHQSKSAKEKHIK